jgi:hypothetical protein
MPLVVFPDVEAWCASYLRDELAARPEGFAENVYVSTQVPSPRLTRMVILRRDGGPRTSVVTERARLGIRVWGESDEVAQDLTQLVRAILGASAGNGPVRRVDEISGPSYIVEESGQPFRYLVLELITRGSALV